MVAKGWIPPQREIDAAKATIRSKYVRCGARFYIAKDEYKKMSPAEVQAVWQIRKELEVEGTIGGGGGGSGGGGSGGGSERDTDVSNHAIKALTSSSNALNSHMEDSKSKARADQSSDDIMIPQARRDHLNA